MERKLDELVSRLKLRNLILFFFSLNYTNNSKMNLVLVQMQ